MKLCHNTSEPKKEQLGYNPAYKYNLVYQTMVHNTNAITKYADEHQVVGETTQSYAGYGKSGSGLAGRLMSKKINFSR